MQAGTAETRWQDFLRYAQDYAWGAQKRFGGTLSDDEMADIARDAVVEALCELPDDDGRVRQAIERRVGASFRQRKREISRMRSGGVPAPAPEAWIDGSAKSGTRLASGKRKLLRCLVKDAANAWAEAWTAPPGEWAPAAAKAESSAP